LLLPLLIVELDVIGGYESCEETYEKIQKEGNEFTPAVKNVCYKFSIAESFDYSYNMVKVSFVFKRYSTKLQQYSGYRRGNLLLDIQNKCEYLEQIVFNL